MIRYHILIPAYNAAETLPTLLHEIKTLEKQPEGILIVDDGSKDDTAKIVQDMQAKLLRFEENRGKGFALRQGWDYLFKNCKCEYVLIMDADLQHPAYAISDFLQYAQQNASRFIIGKRQLSIKKMPIHRLASNYLTSFIISILSGQKIRDSQCGFRLIHEEVLKAMHLNEDRFQMESEMILRASELPVSIDSISVPTIYKSEKSNIGNIQDTLRFVVLILREIRMRIKCVLKDRKKN
jgi:glycosyltransferase involved in cell wall biosynthesis